MRRLTETGVPENAASTRFDVVAPDGSLLPPKVVISLAAQLAIGQPLSRRDFSGGDQTNDRLQQLGFEIRLKPGTTLPAITESDLTPGKKLSNDELSYLFKVGNSGGMRWSSSKQCLVLIADHTKSLYDDRWDGTTFYYTGMGKTGEQKLTGQNKRLAEQPKTGVAVHLFEVFTQGEYLYGGTVQSGAVREEMQPDDDGRLRKVLVFPLTLTGADSPPTPRREELEQISHTRQRQLRTRTLEELRAMALAGGKNVPGKRDTTAVQFDRNEAVVEYAKKAANGICDLCTRPAPFNMSSGPHLECHHLLPLAQGGPDTIDNAVALCPNCHRKIHLLNAATDRRALQNRIEFREKAKNKV